MGLLARPLLIPLLFVVAGCRGDKGDKGDPGADGRQGPPGPAVSIDGLDGGTVRGDSHFAGNMTVTGDLGVGGRIFTFPRNPLVLAGVAADGCRIQPAAGS